MDALITLLILIAVIVTAIWLIKQIPFPAGLELLQTILITIVVVLALAKLLAFW